MRKQDRDLKLFMTFSAVIYGIGAIAFPAAPELVFGIFNALSPPSLPPIPPSTEHFWVTLASSMMATITACCAMVARDPVKYRDTSLPVIVSKLTSTTVGLLFFAFATPRYLAYLGVATTDFPLAVATYFFWNRARKP